MPGGRAHQGATLRRPGPPAGSPPDQPADRLPGHAAAVGGDLLAYHHGGQLPLTAFGPGAFLGAGPAHRAVFIPSRPGVAAWRAGAGGLPGAGLGGVGHAAAHGHLLPALHPAGGRRLSAPRRLQPGPALQAVLRLRQAGAVHVHGLRLQRGRRDRLPHHRLAPRAAAGDPDQQLCALQRPFSHPDRPSDHVLCGRGGGRLFLAAVGFAADGGHCAGGFHDLCHDPPALQNPAAGGALLLHAGTAPLPQAADRQGAPALGVRPHCSCWAGRRRWPRRRAW